MDYPSTFPKRTNQISEITADICMTCQSETATADCSLQKCLKTISTLRLHCRPPPHNIPNATGHS